MKSILSERPLQTLPGGSQHPLRAALIVVLVVEVTVAVLILKVAD
jgi:hypothetical protein